MKKGLGILLALSIVFTCLCPALAEETFSASASGFNGTVTVTITVQDGVITDCAIDAPGETPDLGGKAAAQMAEAIVAGNGEVDAVAGATATSTAVKAALQEAMTSAGLVQIADAAMVPGTYTGKAHGFSFIDYVVVDVTVSDTAIEALSLQDTFMKDMDSFENSYMCNGAFDLLKDTIIDLQSVAVDAVTGATGSSNGIKNAVRDALVQAYMANGVSEQDADALINQHFMTSETKQSGETVELSADVVVVGAGSSGSIASLTALENGASVINIEKTFRWGGQSMLTGGPKVFSPETTDETLDATLVEYDAMNASMRLGTDAVWNDPDYRAEHADEFVDFNHEAYRAVIRPSGSAALLLMDNGLEFAPGFDYSKLAEELGPRPAAGAMPPLPDFNLTEEDIVSYVTGSTINYKVAEEGYAKVYDNFIAKGGTALLQTSVTGLLYDEAGNITGVAATGDDGTEYRISAKQVILATGGYGASKEMLDKYTPGGSAWIYYGWQNNVGDGINMAFEAGAAESHMDAYPMSHQRMGAEFVTIYAPETTPEGNPWSPNDISIVLAVNPDGVYVNAAGTAFKSEEHRSILEGFSGSMGSYYLGSTYYVAYSASQLQAYAENGIPDTTQGFQNAGYGVPANMPMGDWIETVLEYAQSRGWAWKVSSLAEGDAAIGLPNGALEAAYEADATELNRADDEYYWIIEGTGLAISSCGGVLVNQKMQAVREDGTAIENLYVVGNDSFGNIMSTGAEYSIGGDAGMWCFGSGYVAGMTAASAK